MSLSLWLALLGACVVISCTPGAGAINTMSNSLGAGWTRSIWGILGQQLALVVHIAIVAAGVGALVSRSHLAFEVIRYIGAAYLVYLGVRQLRSQAAVGASAPQELREPAWSMFRRGLFVNLTNPKAIVFFLAFLPQFVRPARPLLPQYVVLTATVVTVDVLVMVLLRDGRPRARAADRAGVGPAHRQPRLRRALRRRRGAARRRPLTTGRLAWQGVGMARVLGIGG